jgi:hypothetical protein
MSQPLRDADAFIRLKGAELYAESDCFAVINQNNTVMLMPVFVKTGTSECYILSSGTYLKAETVRGFEKFQLKVPAQPQAPAPANPPEQQKEHRSDTQVYRDACLAREREAFASLAARQQGRRAQSNVVGDDPFQRMAAAERERISEGVRDRLKSRGRG